MSEGQLAYSNGNGAGELTGLAKVQLWGGIECSFTRVGDSYCDQLQLTGHRARLEDLDRIAELGVKALRYPVLWEHHAGDNVDWSWATERLEKLRRLKVEPIIGLVHHGSGPPHTSLLDPSFADGLEAHALEVARRFPWAALYTPVNEPLTTARFSGLYGHWYPHHRNEKSFVRALLVQCDATRQAMKAIRLINPQARLLQTEDMGRTLSTDALAYQAHFDNLRRWLSLDLLCGMVDSEHPLWNFMRENGASEAELDSFVTMPCPPDIIGINYYITSERFLDERLDRYPRELHGGNGREAYADVCAVRVCEQGIAGAYGILKETWNRYQIPMAITEAHLGCTREEQIRWLLEIWSAARQLREEAVDVVAVTVWSMFGAYDWGSLLTQSQGSYEPGVFDLRSGSPRSTALATCIRELARIGTFEHPILAERGWWHRPERLIYNTVHPADNWIGAVTAPSLTPAVHRRPILITGATGTLGSAFKRLADQRGLDCVLLSRSELDIANRDQIETVLNRIKPWAVINAAGYVRVDDAEADFEQCWRENTHGPARLAEACEADKIRLVTFSTDLVFDGNTSEPYSESCAPSPLNVYGRSKAEAERLVLATMPSALVVRTSAFFGPWDGHNFVTRTINALKAGEVVEALCDTVISPTYVPDLVHACLDLLIDGESGICHLTNTGDITWAGLARKASAAAGLPEGLIREVRLSEQKLPASRPRYSVLASGRFQIMPSLNDALARYFAERISPNDALASQLTRSDPAIA